MSFLNSSGFKYRMDSLKIGDESLLFAFDFVSGEQFSNGFLDSASWVSNHVFSGALNGEDFSNFYTSKSSGFFDGSRSVSILGDVPDDDFSFLFCYEKTIPGRAVLLSSSEGSDLASSSGLVLGINDANRLFLEYCGADGNLKCLKHPSELSSKNIVFFKKTFGEFGLGVFDPVTSDLSFVSKAVDFGDYSHSNNFIIASGKPSFWTNRGSLDKDLAFKGYFDDFYCLSGALPNDYLTELFKGFYSIPTGGEISGSYLFCEDITTIISSGIAVETGVIGYETVVTYETGFVPTGYFETDYVYSIGTGITGYEQKYIGDILDDQGVSYPIYARSPLTGEIYVTGVSGYYTGQQEVLIPVYENITLTGLLSGEVFLPVETQVCDTRIVRFPTSMQIDNDFVESFGFKSAYSFHNGFDNHVLELFVYPQNFSGKASNVKPFFDEVANGWVAPIEHSGLGENLFFNNGQLLIADTGSFSYVSGQIKYDIPADLFFDGNIIRSNGFSSLGDSFIYDHSDNISGEWRYLPTGYGRFSDFNSIFDLNYSDYSLFLNGLKLVEDIDYSLSNLFYDVPASSVLVKINNNYLSDSVVRLTGSRNLFETDGLSLFSAGSSQLYVDGLRQILNQDYVELSEFSLLSGSPVPATNENRLVFSSSNDFWNI